MDEKACTACGSPHHPAALHNSLPPAAIWFPPYGNSASQQSPAPDGKPGTVTFASALQAHEDRVAEAIAKLSDAERAIAYKYLYSIGLRIGTVDGELSRAIRKELQSR